MNPGMWSLFHWSLKRDIDLLRTHIVRGLLGAMMMVLVAAAWAKTNTASAAGLTLFEMICWSNVIVMTMAAISYFATGVTEEAEAGNLDLLRLAGMGSFSILLGKSSSRLLSSLLLLVVQFPFTLLAITLGGVTLVQILACYVAVIAHLFVVANLALFCSVYCRSSGRAAVWTTVALLVFYLSPQLFKVFQLCTPANWSTLVADYEKSWSAALPNHSVLEVISKCLSSTFAGPVVSQQAISSVIAGLAFFFLAALGLEKASRRQGVKRPTILSRNRGSLRRLFGVSRAWKWAIVWKEFYYLTGGPVMWVFRVVAFVLVTVAIHLYVANAGQTDQKLYELLAIAALIAMAVEMIVFATRVLFDDVRFGTFPLLAMLPTTAWRIVGQKILGCALALIPALGFLTLTISLSPNPIVAAVPTGILMSGLVNFALLIHATLLLSLFLRWAALPAAVCVVLAFNSCCPIMSLGLVLSNRLGEVGGVPLLLVTLGAYWLLLLLPIEIEIVSRVDEIALKDG